MTVWWVSLATPSPIKNRVGWTGTVVGIYLSVVNSLCEADCTTGPWEVLQTPFFWESGARLVMSQIAEYAWPNKLWVCEAQFRLRSKFTQSHKAIDWRGKGLETGCIKQGMHVLGMLFVLDDFLLFLICLQLEVRGHWHSTMQALCLSALL